METIDILEGYRKLVADGDHKGAQDFLAAHITELPTALQGDILIEHLKDAAAGSRLENVAAETSDLAMKILDRVEAQEEILKELPDEEDAA